MYHRDFLLVLVLTLFVNRAVGTNDGTTEKNNNCREPRIFILASAGNGSFSVDFEEDCDIYVYQIKCLNKSSIIKINSTFTDHNNHTSAKSETSAKIEVAFKEISTLSDGKKSLRALSQFFLDSQHPVSSAQKIYFSRTSDLTVTVKTEGHWSNIDLDFSFEEVVFSEYRRGSKLREGAVTPWVSMEGRGYKPNCVYVFQITKSEDMNASNIDLELKKLQIDEGMGEYLLIGAGKDLFQGPPPLFISSSPSKKRIKIFDENAYVVFVAASTRENYEGFEIAWKYNGTKIDRKEDDKVIERGFLDSSSMPICIFNSTAALNEINKEDPFIGFREKLASIATEYYTEAYKGKKLNIESSQVRIVRVSGLVKEDEEEGLYVMVNIEHNDGKAIFNWKQMGYILNKYSSLFSSSAVNGYRIKECPKKLSQQSRWPLYLIAPILCCICLLIWNWKYTPFSRIFSKKLKKAIVRRRKLQRVPPEDNDCAINSSVPRLETSDGQGIRYPMNQHEVTTPEQDSDNEVFNRMHLRHSNSSRSSAKEFKSGRDSTRSAKKPEINEAFVKDEEYTDEVQNAPTTSTNMTEGFYDSLNSQKSLLGTYITDETKL